MLEKSAILEEIEITGQKILQGQIPVQRSKNVSMPTLVACSLAPNPSLIMGVPKIKDLELLLGILKHLGCKYSANSQNILFEGYHNSNNDIPNKMSTALRGSIYALAVPVLRRACSTISSIGGDVIKGRSIAPHIRALKGFNVKVSQEGNLITLDARKIKPGEFFVEDIGISATGLAIIIGAGLDGTSVLHNCSTELEIRDIVECVVHLGAQVNVHGRTITVKGPLIGNTKGYDVPLDQMAAGTFLIGACASGGEVRLPQKLYPRLIPLINVLIESGWKATASENDLIFEGHPLDCKGVCVETGIYPSYPSDLLPQLSLLCTQLGGSSVIVENIYKSRFDHISQLINMGAKIDQVENKLKITGSSALTGMHLHGIGIRETATLALAGSLAKGNSKLRNYGAIFRGYEDFFNDLSQMSLS